MESTRPCRTDEQRPFTYEFVYGVAAVVRSSHPPEIRRRNRIARDRRLSFVHYAVAAAIYREDGCSYRRAIIGRHASPFSETTVALIIDRIRYVGQRASVVDGDKATAARNIRKNGRDGVVVLFVRSGDVL